jgi:hypothetical protein
MRYCAAILLCLLVFSVPAPAGTPDTASPLDRTVRLDIWNGGLRDALQAVKQQTGIDILPYPPDFPPDRYVNGLYLVTGNVQLGTVLECLSRRYAFRYRLSNTGRIEISKSCDWAATEPALKFARIDGVFPNNGDQAAAEQALRELVKPLSILGDEYSLTLERSPSRDNPQSMRAVIVMPPVLADYLERGIAALSGDPGDARPDPKTAGRIFARAHDSKVQWESFLGNAVHISEATDAQAFFRSLSGDADIAILLASPPENDSSAMPAMSTTTLGQASEAAAARYGVFKRTFLSCGAIIFEQSDSSLWEMDTRRGELFWSGLAVAGFDAGPAAARAGGPGELIAQIRTTVFPAIWSVPACALVFIQATERLCVIAPKNAIDAVSDFLRQTR